MMATKTAKKRTMNVGTAKAPRVSIHPVSAIPLADASERFAIVEWHDVLQGIKDGQAVSIDCKPDELPVACHAAQMFLYGQNGLTVAYRYDATGKLLWMFDKNVSPFIADH